MSWRLLPLLAVAALVVLGAPAWPQQIDDQLITLAFAHEWAATGHLRWGTGEVVEACSSFLQLSLATAWIALGGEDANLFVKRLAVLCGCATVVFAARRVPRSAVGLVLLLALVTWEPIAWWSFAGMETTIFALLLTVGWATLLSPSGLTPSGVGLLGSGPVLSLAALWLAAIARPEGNLHYALGALVLAVRGESRARRAIVVTGIALFTWHALRVSYFGHVFPTPYLVKMAATDPFGPQWGQWGWELLTLGGIGAVLLVGFRFRPLALVPFLVQCVVELRAEADWMGHARYLLPGVCATVVAWAACAPPRALGRRSLAGLLAIVGLASALEPPSVTLEGIALRSAWDLTTPSRWFHTALDTTQLEDVTWIVESAPWDSAVMLEDVGMPGNVAGVRIIDLVGLTDRGIALAWLDPEGTDASLRARFSGAGAPALVRRMKYGDDSFARPVPWLRLPSAQPVTYPQGTALQFRLTKGRPTPEEIGRRWAALHARYPSQGPLTWYYTLDLARRGHLVDAARVAAAATRRFPADRLLEALPYALFAPFDIDDSHEPLAPLRQTGRPIPRAEAAGLALLLAVEPMPDEGQLVTVRWSCDGPVSTVLVRGPTSMPLPGWACSDDTARILVEGLDQRPHRPLPRHVYAGLTLLE
ncbi:MAG: hypothetical protein Q8P18_05545 [Pseudomonadota bacterium]|nr:hypothetical protein [Pseudomonadota bacterium]